MRTGIGLQAALCVAVVMLLLPVVARAIAEDAARAASGGEVARPSVEELAIPRDGAKAAGNARETDTREAMCLMIESAARANDLPLEFFARVIWQESRFQSDAVGPVTRSGERAQGIAHVMPQETRNYVVAITGTSVDEWATASKNSKPPVRASNTTCRELMALLRRAPNP